MQSRRNKVKISRFFLDNRRRIEEYARKSKSGDMAEELGSALQKRVRGCESLYHLQISDGKWPRSLSSIENQKQIDSTTCQVRISSNTTPNNSK